MIKMKPQQSQASAFQKDLHFPWPYQSLHMPGIIDDNRLKDFVPFLYFSYNTSINHYDKVLKNDKLILSYVKYKIFFSVSKYISYLLYPNSSLNCP